MGFLSVNQWMIAIISLFAFILTFSVFFYETQELFSSLSAAILSASITLGSLIILNWLIKSFKK